MEGSWESRRRKEERKRKITIKFDKQKDELQHGRQQKGDEMGNRRHKSQREMTQAYDDGV